jgi:hypothetical protein
MRSEIHDDSNNNPLHVTGAVAIHFNQGVPSSVIQAVNAAMSDWNLAQPSVVFYETFTPFLRLTDSASALRKATRGCIALKCSGLAAMLTEHRSPLWL